jgi:hypothetical protein
MKSQSSDLIRQLGDAYPATGELRFLNLYPFHNIGQPGKSAMLAVFAAYALGCPKTEIDYLTNYAAEQLEKIICAPANEQTTTSRFNALQILGKKNEWPEVFEILLGYICQTEIRLLYKNREPYQDYCTLDLAPMVA